MKKFLIAAGLVAFAGSAVLDAGPVQARQEEAPKIKYNFSSQPWKLDEKFLPREISYTSDEKPGTIIVHTRRKFLYLIMGNDKAKRYGVGVGRFGFKWSGSEKITRKAKWPGWTPPAEMREREPDLPCAHARWDRTILWAPVLCIWATLFTAFMGHRSPGPSALLYPAVVSGFVTKMSKTCTSASRSAAKSSSNNITNARMAASSGGGNWQFVLKLVFHQVQLPEQR